MKPEILNLHIKVLRFESNSVIPTIFSIPNDDQMVLQIFFKLQKVFQPPLKDWK